MEKKSPGRPRLYETSSEKLDAFRKRLESAGYLRKEILVTKEIWEQVMAQAQAHGVGASDAASGLLEYGLQALLGSSVALAPERVTDCFATPPLAAARTGAVMRDAMAACTSGQVGSLLASKTFCAASSNSTPINPITQFFIKRKDAHHG